MYVNEVCTLDGSRELLFAEMYAWSASPTRLCAILLKDVEMHIISFHPFQCLWWCSYQNFLLECKCSIRWQIYIYIYFTLYQHPNCNPIIHLTLTPENIYSDRIAIIHNSHEQALATTTPDGTDLTWQFHVPDPDRLESLFCHFRFQQQTIPNTSMGRLMPETQGIQ